MWALALFIAIQLADASMTATGVAKFGVAVEGNPLLLFFASALGFGVTVVAAKIFAIACATLLHLRSQYLALAILTLAYVMGAIVPWAWVLML